MERKINQENGTSIIETPIPLTLTQDISFIGATFEQFHLNPELLSNVHCNCL